LTSLVVVASNNYGKKAGLQLDFVVCGNEQVEAGKTNFLYSIG